MTINPSKCFWISPKLNSNISIFTVTFDSFTITANDCIRYLGVNLDSKLNFQNHIKIIEHKLSRAVGILWKLKSLIPQTALLKLNYALFHPHQSLQYEAVKLIGGGRHFDSPTPFYQQLNILKVTNLYELETAKFVHNILWKNFFHFFLSSSFLRIKTRFVQRENSPAPTNHTVPISHTSSSMQY